MPIELDALPFPTTALLPQLSARQIELHHGVHQRASVEAVNRLIAGTDWEGSEAQPADLGRIVRESQGALFEAASQAWNQAFQWRCLRSRSGGAEPLGALGERIRRQFGDVTQLGHAFCEAGRTLFGSGWVWLVALPDGRLAVQVTRNAGSPLTGDAVPLLACSVWEHAYYLDYQNDRGRYLEAFWQRVNWEFVENQLP